MKNNIANRIIEEICQLKLFRINLMEVCGTHTMVIARTGIRNMLPQNKRLISGPGCPVCVTPQQTIDYAIALAQHKDIIITTFGDMVKVPGSKSTLEEYSPRIVYSPLDTLKIAQENPRKDVVFIGVGFETTSPTIAATILTAQNRELKNFYCVPAFKLIPPALDFICHSPQIGIQGFILPGHVSTIIGERPYQFLAEKYHIPGCITGFEPIDVLQGILNLVRQIAHRDAKIDIEYKRGVKPEGNRKAQELLNKVFKPTDSNWRGIGVIPNSGLTFKKEYQRFDATKKFKIDIPETRPPRGCICGKVLLGLKSPDECSLFGQRCTPYMPVGPCMVSSEGSCAAYYKYGNKWPRVKRGKERKN